MKLFYLDTGPSNRHRNGEHYGYDRWRSGILGPLTKEGADKASALISGKTIEYELPTDIVDQITQEVIDQAATTQKVGEDRPNYNKMVRELNASDMDWESKVETQSYEEVRRVYENEFKNFMRDQVEADLEQEEEEDEEEELEYDEKISIMARSDFDWTEFTDGSKKKEDVNKAWNYFKVEFETEVLA